MKIENETNLAGRRTGDVYGHGQAYHRYRPRPAPRLDVARSEPASFPASIAKSVIKDGGYWLHDVSTNGTFLNGADQRMRGPHRLRNGDRFIIGQYIILAVLDAEDAEARGCASQPAASTASGGADTGICGPTRAAVAPPIDPKQLRIPEKQHAR